MNKYYPESMRSAVRALEEVAYQADTVKRINEQFQNEISKGLRPLVDQAAHVQIGIKPLSFDFSAIKIQTEMNISIAEQMRKISLDMQSPALAALKDMSFTSDFLTQMNMRGMLYNVSTIEIDEDAPYESAQTVTQYRESLIKFSPVVAQELVGITIWTYTAYQFMSNPNLLEFVMLALSYIYNNGMLVKDIKDEK